MLNALTSDGLYKRFGKENAESSNSIYSRYNFRANVEVSLNKRLSAQLNIGGSVDQKKNPGDLYTNNTIGLIDRIAPNAFPVYNPNGSFGGNSTYSGNPLANLLSTGFSTSNGTTLQSSLRMTQKLDMVVSGLSASAAVSFNNYFLGGSNKRKNYQRYSATRGVLGDTVYSAFGQRTSLVPEEPVLSQYRNYAVQGSLNYDKTFGNNSFSGLVLFNSDNFILDRNYPNTDAANQALPYKTNSVGTRLTYTKNEKYIAEFAGSYMGAENFPKDRRYGFFPSASLGWIASKESFLSFSKFVDFLKIRVSYGLVGNENIGGQRFAFAQRYPFIASYYLGSGNNTVNSLGEGRRVNNGVTWEKEKKANIGVDLNMGKRFGIVLDVFKNNRYDVLASANGTLPLFLGFNGLPDLNIGKASNKGFEFAVKYNNDTKKKVQFYVEAFTAFAKSKIDYNGEPAQPNTNLYKTGAAIGQPFGLKALGLFQSAAEIAASPKPLGIVIIPGDIKYQDIGGPGGIPDGIIDGNDVTAIGKTSIPEWNFGFNTAVSYKSFDVNLIFQGVAGLTQYLSGSRYHAFQNNGHVNEMALDRWTTQTATSATYPRLSADNNQNNYRFSSFWQKNGSFLKLRVAEIGYTLTKKLQKQLRLSQARVFLNGTNLLTFDKIKEGDAEALYGYPQIRSVSIGLKVNL
jgi:TonB-linked SusC/RagA family outer membrane protein